MKIYQYYSYHANFKRNMIIMPYRAKKCKELLLYV